jgi:hypothetical protein
MRCDSPAMRPRQGRRHNSVKKDSSWVRRSTLPGCHSSCLLSSGNLEGRSSQFRLMCSVRMRRFTRLPRLWRGGQLTFTSEVVRGVNAVKRSVYTLIMTNLACDVECGGVEPHNELLRLYPKQPAPSDTKMATALLYAHCAQERA